MKIKYQTSIKSKLTIEKFKGHFRDYVDTDGRIFSESFSKEVYGKIKDTNFLIKQKSNYFGANTTTNSGSIPMICTGRLSLVNRILNIDLTIRWKFPFLIFQLLSLLAGIGAIGTAIKFLDRSPGIWIIGLIGIFVVGVTIVYNYFVFDQYKNNYLIDIRNILKE